MKEKTIFPRSPCLAFIDGNRLLTYKAGGFYILDMTDRVERFLCRAKIPLWMRILWKSKLCTRLFRLDRCTLVRLNENIYIVALHKYLWSLDITQKTIERGAPLDHKIPLNIVYVSKIDGFADGAYWGDYKNSMVENEVSIYRADSAKKWNKVYSFEPGRVGHIHNILPDKYRKCLWILTGDFGEHAAIWRANDNFSRVECVLKGSQLYRGCFGVVRSDRIIYATDSPLEQNYVMALIPYADEYRVEKIQEIAGPAIYGCAVGNSLAFSTSVEAATNKCGKIAGLLCRRPGPGIWDSASHLYVGSPESGFHDVRHVAKDHYPYALFRFGVQMFPIPSGEDSLRLLPVYSVALYGHDLEMELIEL